MSFCEYKVWKFGSCKGILILIGLLSFSQSLLAGPSGMAKACRAIREVVSAPTSGAGVSPEACGTYFESHSLRVGALFQHLVGEPKFLEAFPEYRSLFRKPARMITALADHDLGKRLDQGALLNSQYGIASNGPTIKEDLARTFGKPFEELSEAERQAGNRTVKRLNDGDHSYSRRILKEYKFSPREIELFLELEDQLDLFDRFEDSQTQALGKSLDYGRKLTPTSEFMLSGKKGTGGEVTEYSSREKAKIKRSRAYRVAQFLETEVRSEYPKIVKPFQFQTYSYRKYALGTSFHDLVADQALDVKESSSRPGVLPGGKSSKGQGARSFLKKLGLVGAGLTVVDLASSPDPVIDFIDSVSMGAITKLSPATVAHGLVTDGDIFKSLNLAEKMALLREEHEVYKTYILSSPFVDSLTCSTDGLPLEAQIIFPQKFPFPKTPVHVRFQYRNSEVSKIHLDLTGDLEGHKVSFFPGAKEVQFQSPVRNPIRWIRTSYQQLDMPTSRSQRLKPSYDYDYDLKNRSIADVGRKSLNNLPQLERCCQLSTCQKNLEAQKTDVSKVPEVTQPQKGSHDSAR